MTWDELLDTHKDAITRQMLAGIKKTPENFNRAKEILMQNPMLVEKYYNELYKTDGTSVEDTSSETFEDESGLELGQMKEAEAEL